MKNKIRNECIEVALIVDKLTRIDLEGFRRQKKRWKDVIENNMRQASVSEDTGGQALWKLRTSVVDPIQLGERMKQKTINNSIYFRHIFEEYRPPNKIRENLKSIVFSNYFNTLNTSKWHWFKSIKQVSPNILLHIQRTILYR